MAVEHPLKNRGARSRATHHEHVRAPVTQSSFNLPTYPRAFEPETHAAFDCHRFHSVSLLGPVSRCLVEGLASTRRRSREGDLDRPHAVGCERRQAPCARTSSGRAAWSNLSSLLRTHGARGVTCAAEPPNGTLRSSSRIARISPGAA